MQTLWTVLVVASVLLAVASLVDVVRRKLGRGRIAAWALVILIVPLAGSVLYWSVRLRARDPGNRQPQSAGSREACSVTSRRTGPPWVRARADEHAVFLQSSGAVQ